MPVRSMFSLRATSVGRVEVVELRRFAREVHGGGDVVLVRFGGEDLGVVRDEVGLNPRRAAGFDAEVVEHGLGGVDEGDGVVGRQAGLGGGGRREQQRCPGEEERERFPEEGYSGASEHERRGG